MFLTLLAQVPDDYYTSGQYASDLAKTQAAAGTGLAIWGGLMIFWFIFWIAAFILWLVALLDVIKRNFPNQSDKILWLVLILVLPGLGPILYFIIGRKKGTKA